MKRNFLKSSILLVVFLMAGLFSCQKDQIPPSDGELAFKKVNGPKISNPVSEQGVIPYIIPGNNPGGNRTCAEVAHHFSLDVVASTGKFDFDGEMWIDSYGMPVAHFPYDGILVTYDPHTNLLSFVADIPGYCIGAVIVKGGPAANIYAYPNGITEDHWLAAPVNASGKPAGLSNLTFCLIECQEEMVDETAYGGDYLGAGSAWWYYYDTHGPVEQAFYAGQNLVAGAMVKYEDGKIIIVTGANMGLAPGSETVKIQGYDILPNSRPASGGFVYKGNQLEVPVNPFRYYVIHLDAMVVY